MYGLISKIMAVPGKRDELVSILVKGTVSMPGCRSYIVAKDPTDAESIWVTEVWEDQESHKSSLSLPSVQVTLTEGKPLISGFGERFETLPIGGHGLSST